MKFQIGLKSAISQLRKFSDKFGSDKNQAADKSEKDMSVTLDIDSFLMSDAEFMIKIEKLVEDCKLELERLKVKYEINEIKFVTHVFRTDALARSSLHCITKVSMRDSIHLE
jgi:hypothetical protein